ncbi:MAG: glycosyltransferase family 2 protein [Candidatus Falkowbacteria bacterium]|nr:glycosyltransferase family 2 protein [Candidatus Falkowbacteria bacterium]
MINQKISGLSLFFPAWNEEKNIKGTIEKALSVMEKATFPFEIIIVDDGSWDNTKKIAAELAETTENIRVVSHERNLGYGAAIWTGIREAKYEYTFFADADQQFDLNEINELMKYIPDYQVVLGYRRKRQENFIRLANAKAWNLLNLLFFGLKVKDIDCAFKLFKTDLVKNLKTESRGAMLSAEILIQLQRRGIKFKEVPVTHLPRRAGSSTGAKLSVILRAFKEFWQTYKRLRHENNN